MLPEIMPKGKARKEAKAKKEGYTCDLIIYIYMNTNFGERRWYIRECIERFGININGIVTKDPHYKLKVGDTISIKWDDFSFYNTTKSNLIMKCW